MAEEPLVSVLMTAYNREKYIAEAIKSVLSSTYSNWELIIVDDCSNDDTVSIAKEFEKKDNRIRVYINEENIKQFENRNRAASYAKGKYLKYLDSDDKIFVDGLEYCVEQMENYPNASIGLVTFHKKYGVRPIAISSEEIIRSHFFGGADLTIGPTGSIIRTECFIRNGGFDPKFKVASDNYFNIVMAMLGDVVVLPYQYFYYRQHEGQEINNSTDYLIYNFLYNKELFDRHKLPLSVQEVNFLKRKLQKRHSVNLIKYFLKTKDIKKAVSIMNNTDYSLLNFFRAFFY